MKYRFLSEEEQQGLRYELCQNLERQHYSLELRRRQIRRVAPESEDLASTEEQMESLEAQIDAVLEDDEPR